MTLAQCQIDQLLRPVNPRRVHKDNDGNSHLAGYEVAAHLTRIFGFCGWKKKIRSLELVSEECIKDERRNRPGWHVTYRCEMTLIIRDPHGVEIWDNDDGATGSASNLPSRGDAHDFAMKNAITYALKRCAKDLGDQFGLSLYNRGQVTALVGAVLTEGSTSAGSEDAQQHTPDAVHPDTSHPEACAEVTTDPVWLNKAREAIGNATTSRALAVAEAEITRAVKAGEVADSDRDHLRGLCKQARKDIAAANAPDPEPQPEREAAA